MRLLSVSIHKDIGEYSEKIVGKLSFRTLICVTGGLAAAVAAAAFTYFVLGIDVSNATLPVMAVSMPFWLAGFWRPYTMKLEQFMPLWFQHTFNDDRILYASSIDKAEPALRETLAQKQDRKHARKAKRKGAELYEPSREDIQREAKRAAKEEKKELHAARANAKARGKSDVNRRLRTQEKELTEQTTSKRRARLRRRTCWPISL